MRDKALCYEAAEDRDVAHDVINGSVTSPPSSSALLSTATKIAKSRGGPETRPRPLQLTPLPPNASQLGRVDQIMKRTRRTRVAPV